MGYYNGDNQPPYNPDDEQILRTIQAMDFVGILQNIATAICVFCTVQAHLNPTVPTQQKDFLNQVSVSSAIAFVVLRVAIHVLMYIKRR